MDTSPIGFLDSGFGGLSIWQSVTALLPNESTVYVGDHAFLPYGLKTKRQIQQRAVRLIKFLLDHHAKLIIVACNTATIAGIDVYRRRFPHVPIIGVVPVVKTASEQTKVRSFAVLSTSFTAGSAYQKKLIHTFAPSSNVHNLGCPNLLSFVEQGVLTGRHIDGELRRILTPAILKNIDVVVLGCTHYAFLRRAIRAIVGSKIRVLDSGGAVARHAARILAHNRIAGKVKRPTHEFYSTAGGNTVSRVAGVLLKKNVNVQYADI